MAATQADGIQEVAVDVTFLRMDAPPADPPRPLPPGLRIDHASRCSVPFYRYLYDTVGEPWLWWMRRTASDADLAALVFRTIPDAGRVLRAGCRGRDTLGVATRTGGRWKRS